MQQEGKPKFLKFHQGKVRGVAFSPRVLYYFYLSNFPLLLYTSIFTIILNLIQFSKYFDNLLSKYKQVTL